MANKKRDRNGYKSQLGRYRMDRADILAIEKMLKVYADAREKKMSSKFGHSASPPLGRKHMPRKYTDMNIKIGRYRPFHIELGVNHLGIHYPGFDYIYDADSVKFLPSAYKKSRYVKIECHPGISVTFRPFSTQVYAQTHYATGKELHIMKQTVAEVEGYLASLPKSFMNICILRK